MSFVSSGFAFISLFLRAEAYRFSEYSEYLQPIKCLSF